MRRDRGARGRVETEILQHLRCESVERISTQSGRHASPIPVSTINNRSLKQDERLAQAVRAHVRDQIVEVLALDQREDVSERMEWNHARPRRRASIESKIFITRSGHATMISAAQKSRNPRPGSRPHRRK